jgi:chemotaxis protein methyltransferase CheR
MTDSVSFADFDYVRRLVYEHSAISLDDSKGYLVEARLAPVARREGMPSVSELIRSVRNGDDRLRKDVAIALATHETTFFRDVHPFTALADTVIPDVLARNGGRSLAIWSAAASTGQEAYSLAMLTRDQFPGVPAVTILGTDLSPDVVARARTGRFSQLEVNRGLPTRLLLKHFYRDGSAWQVCDELRRRVTFRQLNLARDFDGVPVMDVVFLRNVLIYFDGPTKVRVLERIARILRPGGYLFLGASETPFGIATSYERLQSGKAIFYRLTTGKEAR